MFLFRSNFEAPSLFSPAWGSKRKPLIIATCMSATLLQLLLLGLSAYLFGVLFRGELRIDNFQVLYVDFDGGTIGQSIRSAYSQLSGDTFITLREQLPSIYRSGTDIRNAICQGEYWGAIYIEAGASQHLTDHITGNSPGPWNSTSTAVTVNMGIRYATVQQSWIIPDFQELFLAAQRIYIVDSLNSAKTTANLTTLAPILASPFSYTSIDLSPTPQGMYAFYNTASTVFLILLQFFSILAFNGIFEGFGVLTGASIRSHLSFRIAFSFVYTLVGSLLSVTYIWAFKETWAVYGNQFCETWMLLWLSMHIHWLAFDVYRANAPMSAMPFFAFPWIILNLASTVMPFELSPGFYKIGYIWPAHNTWEALINIWSGGCYNRLYRNMPILFAWWIVMFLMDLISQIRKCNGLSKAKCEGQNPVDEATYHEKDYPLTITENKSTVDLARPNGHILAEIDIE